LGGIFKWKLVVAAAATSQALQATISIVSKRNRCLFPHILAEAHKIIYQQLQRLAENTPVSKAIYVYTQSAAQSHDLRRH
jgi:hypothetical protein